MLVLTVQDSTEPGELADLSCDFVHVYAPAPAVVVLPARASPAVVSALRHAHQMRHDLDVLLPVVTPSAPVRRILHSRP
ncbi:hypothetical protein B0675_26320 [Streptomyces sp. M41(2017)]|nr:hypothetical protein B0675_26320 [Streptomyces sp. M41(2017)]